MLKTDKSIYNIVRASIKRHSMDMETWKKTMFWEDGDAEVISFLSIECSFEIEELPILYFYLNQKNWTVFSSRAIYYSNNDKSGEVSVGDIKEYDFDVGTFKRGAGVIDTISVLSKGGIEHRFLYETGKPSMGAIYGTQTLIQVSG